MPDAIDEFMLLCESCGYALAGLPTEGHCPECGREIAESLPEKRTGSPWQLRQGPGLWVRSASQMVMHPSGFFRRLRAEQTDGVALLVVNSSITAFAIVAISIVGGDPIAALEVWILVGAVAGVVWWVGAIGLSVAQALCIRLLSRRAGWRVTSAMAWSVLGHASVVWVLGALLALLTTIVDVATRPDHDVWEPRPILESIPGFALLGAVLVFEVLVYIGIRRCRFANRMPPGAGGA